LFALDGDVAAVLDWEMAELGPAEVDLGWWLVTEEFYGTGLGVAMLEGVPDEQQTVRRWEQLVGRPAREVDYYKLLAALRYALVLVRARDINVQRGGLSDDSTMHTNNPMTQTIARLLGVPVPPLAPEFAHMVASYAAERDAAAAPSSTANA
jgi:aminoglycoside phosphotransferase (APT) family kinase protein